MRSLLILLMLIGIGPNAMAQGLCGCGAKSGVGPAFKVHGRLSAWNGTPALRIWIVGTKRVLGVHGEASDQSLPANLKAIDESFFENHVFGDFEVCPLTKTHPGAMQIVCIKSASSLVIKRIKHS
jgi:hypothetical protein